MQVYVYNMQTDSGNTYAMLYPVLFIQQHNKNGKGS